MKERFYEASLIKAVTITIAYLATAYVAIFGLYELMTSGVPAALAVPTGIIVILLIVRQQRALENVVHFGSHLNFSKKRGVNDLFVDSIAAWPMLSDVREYRTFHRDHHGYYGGHDDPCRLRFERIGVSDAKLSTTGRLVIATLRWLPMYIREYYSDVGSRRRQVTIFIAWHCLATALLAMITAPAVAISMSAIWMGVMFVLLPFVRLIAEVREHDYESGATEFDTTYSNLGVWDHLLFHPAGDAWHILHHLYPTIPWWHQRQAHRFLMKRDAEYRHAHRRSSILRSTLDGAAFEPKPRSRDKDAAAC
ncbi:MAG: fatty acid desaturase [Azospirillaceae bacterium]